MGWVALYIYCQVLCLRVHEKFPYSQVKIREIDSDVEYSVPVTSTLEFGPIYNPYQRDALRGFVYPTVADLLKVIESAPLPKFISAMNDSSITTPGDRVTKGELLLIKEVRLSNKFGYRQLKVQSLLTNTEKFLHEACQGNFTTRPESTKLSLLTIIKHIPDALPLSVKIFPGASLDLGDQHYPTHLFEKVVQLCQTFTDVLLVASSVPEDSVCDGREPFEIPQEVELELKVVKLKENDYEQLRDKSTQIMRRIQGDYIKQYRNAHTDQADYIVQDMFLKAVTTTDETAPSPETDSANEQCNQDHDYPNIKPVHDSLLSRLGKLENIVWKMKESQALGTNESEKSMTKSETDPEPSEATSHVDDQQQPPETHSEGVDDIRTELMELKTQLKLQQKQFQEELQRMQAEVVALQSEVAEGRKELQDNPPPPQPQAISIHQQQLLATPESAERNMQIVATLTPAQVLTATLYRIITQLLTENTLISRYEEECTSVVGPCS